MDLDLNHVRFKIDHDGDLQVEVLDSLGQERDTYYMTPAEVGQLIEFWNRRAHSAPDKP